MLSADDRKILSLCFLQFVIMSHNCRKTCIYGKEKCSSWQTAVSDLGGSVYLVFIGHEGIDKFYQGSTSCVQNQVLSELTLQYLQALPETTGTHCVFDFELMLLMHSEPFCCCQSLYDSHIWLLNSILLWCLHFNKLCTARCDGSCL